MCRQFESAPRHHDFCFDNRSDNNWLQILTCPPHKRVHYPIFQLNSSKGIRSPRQVIDRGLLRRQQTYLLALRAFLTVKLLWATGQTRTGRSFSVHLFWYEAHSYR